MKHIKLLPIAAIASTMITANALAENATAPSPNPAGQTKAASTSTTVSATSITNTVATPTNTAVTAPTVTPAATTPATTTVPATTGATAATTAPAAANAVSAPTSANTPATPVPLSTSAPTPLAASPNSPPSLVPPAPTIDAKGYVIMDGNSGMILAQSNMDQRMEPASLTKLMTVYATFQALKNGQIHLNDNVRISQKAWQTGGSKMFVRVGTDVTVDQLLQGVIVDSGNDACVALAEYVGGTEDTFAQLMNQTAQRLGMTGTHYVDSNGLPNPDHYSTPHDIAILAHAIYHDFPEYYHYFGEKWFTYNNIKQPNRNRLLWRDPSVDGMKTGHTDGAGYCLVSSSNRNGMRLITVVMGAPTDSARADDSQALLNYAFRFYKSYKLFDSGVALATPKVWYGTDGKAELGLSSPLYVTIPVGEYNKLQAQIKLPKKIEAPLAQGQAVGSILVTLNGNTVSETPLVALKADAAGNWLSRAIDSLHSWL